MDMEVKRTFRRGNIYYCDFGKTGVGSEQWGVRPCVVVQNDVGNRHANTLQVIPITSRTKTDLPTHIAIPCLEKKSIAMAEQTRVVSIDRMREYVGRCDDDTMFEINKALLIEYGLVAAYQCHSK